MTVWIVLLCMGAVTYALRLSLIAAIGCFELRALTQRALRFVPPAVLAAIIAPEVLAPGGVVDVSPGNMRLLAGLAAVVVAWRTRNVLLTIAVGMAVLWAMTALA